MIEGHYVKWNKSDTERQWPYTYDFTYVWNLKKNDQINWNGNRLIDKKKRLMVSRGEKGEGE